MMSPFDFWASVWQRGADAVSVFPFAAQSPHNFHGCILLSYSGECARYLYLEAENIPAEECATRCLCVADYWSASR